MIGYGIDVSHHQDPKTLPWEEFRGHVDFVMVRAAYGVHLDEKAREHTQRARGIGAQVGLYLFFRHSQPVADQVVAILRTVESCGLGTGDIVPAVDIEDDLNEPVTPDWSAPAELLVEWVEDHFQSSIIYTSRYVWMKLGKPEWLLHRPIWASHWVDGPPATPGGMPATIHQHRVGPFEPNGPGGKFGDQLDQNRLLLPLPRIGYTPSDEDKARVAALVAENLRNDVEDGHEEENV